MKKDKFLIRYFFRKPRKKAFTAALLVLVISLVLTGQVLRHNNIMILGEKRQVIQSELELYGNTLTVTLNSSFSLLKGLHAFAQSENTSSPEHLDDVFYHLAENFFESASSIRNFSLAPQGVQTYVYPKEGNEEVFGHNLLNDERLNVRVDVEKAIESRRITLSIPYELRQGGLGIVARKAVFLDNEFWGFVAMVVDIPSILSSAGLSNDNANLVFALEDKNGDVFFGEKKILNEQPVDYKIILPDGYWTLSAVPRSGWDLSSQRFSVIQLAGGLISIMLALLTYLFVNRDERLRHNVDKKTQALSDVLTELEESEKKYRELVELAQEGIWVIDSNSRTTFVNPSMEKMLGYDEGEMLGKEIFSFMDEREIEIATRNVERRKEGIAEQHDFEYIRKDGERITVTMQVAPIMDENGDYAGSIAGVIDITKRREIEKALQKNELRIRKYFEQGLLGMAITSREKVWIEANDALCTMFGYSHEELSELTWEEITHPEDLEANLLLFDRIESGEIDSYSLDKRFLRKNGSILYAELSASAIRKEDGSVDYLITLVNDITTRKLAEVETIKNRNQLGSIFKSVPAGIGMIVDRKIQFVNERFVKMVGLID